jgi:endo-1,4-beta-xylanase
MVCIVRIAVSLLPLLGAANAFAPRKPYGPETLDKAMKCAGKLYFGTATDQNTLSNPKVEAIVKKEFGAVTPENSMKWESTER